jgi:hypothetical protein
MKTKIFFITGLTLLMFTSYEMQAQLKYGLHAGMNLETQAEIGTLWNNVDLYQGYMAGAFFEYGIGNKLSFQAELNYQKKGEKTNTTIGGEKIVVRREFDYISVPVLIKGTFHPSGIGDNWDLTLFTGPYAGYLASANANSKTGSTTTSLDIDNQVEKTDFGAIFGGGVAYRTGNGGAIVAELRYEMGLSKVDKTNPDLRNKGCGITIGYRF